MWRERLAQGKGRYEETCAPAFSGNRVCDSSDNIAFVSGGCVRRRATVDCGAWDRLMQAQRNAGAGKAAGDIGTDTITAEADGEQHASGEGTGQGGRGNTFVNESRPPAPQSYEEIYAHFLAVMEECGLSERELEVAWLLYRGYTNRQIGEELYIAETTVKKHVSHIYQKMDVCSRKEFRAKVREGSAAGLCSGG